MYQETKTLVMATIVTMVVLSGCLFLKTRSNANVQSSTSICKTEKSAAMRFEDGMRGRALCESLDPQEAAVSLPWRIQ